MAALGIAIKPIIVPLVHIITGPLFIPGGVVAGGMYMMFLVLAMAITQKRMSAFYAALVQAVLVTISGTLGSHGAASLLTYVLPGIGVELVMLLMRHKCCCALCCMIAGITANMIGSFAVNLAIFSLPAIPMILSLCASALSGAIGGLIANALAKRLLKLGILHK